jgi:hypothetical protein
MAGIASNELVLVVSDPVLTRLVGLRQGGELAQPPVRLGRGASRLLLLASGQPSDIKSRCRNRCSRFRFSHPGPTVIVDPDPNDNVNKVNDKISRVLVPAAITQYRSLLLGIHSSSSRRFCNGRTLRVSRL